MGLTCQETIKLNAQGAPSKTSETCCHGRFIREEGQRISAGQFPQEQKANQDDNPDNREDQVGEAGEDGIAQEGNLPAYEERSGDATFKNPIVN
jgi:hypothetical protein